MSGLNPRYYDFGSHNGVLYLLHKYTWVTRFKLVLLIKVKRGVVTLQLSGCVPAQSFAGLTPGVKMFLTLDSGAELAPK